MACVYQHRRLDTGHVFYVGIGKKEDRAYSKHSRNQHWYNVTKKCDYLVEITHKDICYEEAQSIEKYLIEFYGRTDFNTGSLVNKTSGGEGVANPSVRLTGEKHPMFGKQHSEITKSKMKLAAKNKPPIKKSTLEKKRLIMLGSANPMFGRTGEKSPCYKKVRSEETRRKISLAKRGKPNMKMKGELHPMYGMTGGKNPAAKMVIDTATGKIYECAKYAALELEMAPTTLRNMLNGTKENKTNLKYI
jgi:hypothetical protein